jgi:hypothetical protein
MRPVRRLSDAPGQKAKAKAEGRKRKSNGRLLSDFRDLKAGDFVVHVDHGIARFGACRCSISERAAAVHAAFLPRMKALRAGGTAISCSVIRVRKDTSQRPILGGPA